MRTKVHRALRIASLLARSAPGRGHCAPGRGHRAPSWFVFFLEGSSSFGTNPSGPKRILESWFRETRPTLMIVLLLFLQKQNLVQASGRRSTIYKNGEQKRISALEINFNLRLLLLPILLLNIYYLLYIYISNFIRLD
jgi:hypothetical protein